MGPFPQHVRHYDRAEKDWEERTTIDGIDMIRTRRSVRRFRPNAVPREAPERLIEEACCAPSPHGTRPWRFAVVTAPEGKKALAD